MMITESSHNKNIQIINFSSLLAVAVISDNAECRHNDESYLQYGNTHLQFQHITDHCFIRHKTRA